VLTNEKISKDEAIVLFHNFPNDVHFLSDLSFNYPKSAAITLVSKIKKFVKSSTRLRIKSVTGYYNTMMFLCNVQLA
jgi:hypothetical protein